MPLPDETLFAVAGWLCLPLRASSGRSALAHHVGRERNWKHFPVWKNRAPIKVRRDWWWSGPLGIEVAFSTLRDCFPRRSSYPSRSGRHPSQPVLLRLPVESSRIALSLGE